MSNQTATAGGARTIFFEDLGRDCYAARLTGAAVKDKSGSDLVPDANIGVVVGRKSVLVVDAGAHPSIATAVEEAISGRFGKPVRYVALTHFHARQTLGVTGFDGADIVVSDLTRRMLADHGPDNRLLALARDSSGLAGSASRRVRSTINFASSMTLDLGDREVRLMHLGRGHTLGDTVVWVEDERVMFTGGLVATSIAPYCGDGHIGDWPRVLTRMAAFRPNAIMPSRGTCAIGPNAVARALDQTSRYLSVLKTAGFEAVESGASLAEVLAAVDEAMPADLKKLAAHAAMLRFNVARTYDEAKGVDMPPVWTTEREAALGRALGAADAPAAKPAKSAQSDEIADDTPEEAAETEAAETEPAETDAIETDAGMKDEGETRD
ncbi:MBL fold metallo-hydrolase [Roseibium aestuarii]|uniref:MBL fold metallo-hydrolase n=1 Tax=Roseibium aestuarii TaxID=2600299 RepID=A0ABW4JR85_9HYPH|nr:MBL fold metallo-hydrolase [Roseibium aestuarii]